MSNISVDYFTSFSKNAPNFHAKFDAKDYKCCKSTFEDPFLEDPIFKDPFLKDPLLEDPPLLFVKSN